MRPARIGSVTAALAAGLAALPGGAALAAHAAAAPTAAVLQVSPGRGGPRAAFTITFRASVDTTADPYNESYEMDVKGPAHSACAADEGVYTSSGRRLHRGQLVHVRVSAPYRHARWCAGAYVGSIHEVSVNPSSSCEAEPQPAACANGSTLVGTFRFRAVR